MNSPLVKGGRLGNGAKRSDGCSTSNTEGQNALLCIAPRLQEECGVCLAGSHT